VHIVEELLRLEYTGGQPPFKRRPRAEASA
jgi:hypothetical protein